MKKIEMTQGSLWKNILSAKPVENSLLFSTLDVEGQPIGISALSPFFHKFFFYDFSFLNKYNFFFQTARFFDEL